jgi:hypothetical protein
MGHVSQVALYRAFKVGMWSGGFVMLVSLVV